MAPLGKIMSITQKGPISRPMFTFDATVSMEKARGLAAELSVPQGTATPTELLDECGNVEEEDEEDDMEEMFVSTSAGLEWGGPMRGGRMREPTRFGDWERKGRCSDF